MRILLGNVIRPVPHGEELTCGVVVDLDESGEEVECGRNADVCVDAYGEPEPCEEDGSRIPMCFDHYESWAERELNSHRTDD